MELNHLEIDVLKKALRILKDVETEQAYINGFPAKYAETKIEYINSIMKKLNGVQKDLEWEKPLYETSYNRLSEFLG
jgi:hypothetical protein